MKPGNTHDRADEDRSDASDSQLRNAETRRVSGADHGSGVLSS